MAAGTILAVIPEPPGREAPRAICLSGGAPAATTFAPLAEALDGRAHLIPKDLEGYADDFPDDYGPATEVEGIIRAANAAGWERFHLVGQSFGASVALHFACQHPGRVQSLVLNEPPFVGNDVTWSVEYSDLLESLDDALRAPLADRPAAFVRALTAPGGPMPLPASGATADWRLPRSERQGRMWPVWRNGANGLEQLVPVAPMYVVVGGRTHPGFLTVARWLQRQALQAELEIYSERSHFDPPHVSEAGRFAQALLARWEGQPASAKPAE
jgi:pimeloyl-ACP methyl ester carboxylesterase